MLQNIPASPPSGHAGGSARQRLGKLAAPTVLALTLVTMVHPGGWVEAASAAQPANMHFTAELRKGSCSSYEQPSSYAHARATPAAGEPSGATPTESQAAATPQAAGSQVEAVLVNIIEDTESVAVPFATIPL